MKVLIITNTFPPITGSHVQRMLKMANALAESEIEVSVLTYEINKNHPMYDESFINLVDSRINVIRAPIGFLHRKAYSSFTDASNAHYNKDNPKSQDFKQIIYSLINKFKKDILFPDTMIDWYYAVISYEKKTRNIKKLDPDIIISCSQPNTVHLIGYKLCQLYKKPHYMDYADPWVFLGDYEKIENTIRFKSGRRMEKKIIENAVGFSFSAPGCRDLYVAKYGIQLSDTTVAMSGFEERLLTIAKNEYIINEEPVITMTYGGALQEYVRDPKPFYIATKEFEKDIDVIIRTDNLIQAQRWLEETGGSNCIRILPYLSFDEYYKEMLKVDVILFFGNKNDIQVPGKIFNCIATGKYILYIKSNNKSNDTVEQILSSYGRAIITNNSIDGIKNALRMLVSNKVELRNKPNLASDSIMQFSDKVQFLNLAAHLKRIEKEKFKTKEK